MVVDLRGLATWRAGVCGWARGPSASTALPQVIWQQTRPPKLVLSIFAPFSWSINRSLDSTKLGGAALPVCGMVLSVILVINWQSIASGRWIGVGAGSASRRVVGP